MATDPPHGRAVVQRYPRSTRWLHAGVYTSVLVLLGTGIWLLVGREGAPSPLSRLTGVADTRLHLWVGWAFAGLVVVGVVVGPRTAVGFVVASVRFRRRDLVWFRRWPAALVTGRFPHHDGHFDPGQRVANLAMLLCFLAVIGSGVGMAVLHGGPAFVWLVPVHRWATYLLVPLLAGHVLIASGVLPGYRGVWRSMHLGGRLEVAVARRLWPGWTARQRSSSLSRRRPGRLTLRDSTDPRDATPSAATAQPRPRRRAG